MDPIDSRPSLLARVIVVLVVMLLIVSLVITTLPTPVLG
jgi:hypothetical protein